MIWKRNKKKRKDLNNNNNWYEFRPDLKMVRPGHVISRHNNKNENNKIETSINSVHKYFCMPFMYTCLLCMLFDLTLALVN